RRIYRRARKAAQSPAPSKAASNPRQRRDESLTLKMQPPPIWLRPGAAGATKGAMSGQQSNQRHTRPGLPKQAEATMSNVINFPAKPTFAAATKTWLKVTQAHP